MRNRTQSFFATCFVSCMLFGATLMAKNAPVNIELVPTKTPIIGDGSIVSLHLKLTLQGARMPLRRFRVRTTRGKVLSVGAPIANIVTIGYQLPQLKRHTTVGLTVTMYVGSRRIHRKLQLKLMPVVKPQPLRLVPLGIPPVIAPQVVATAPKKKVSELPPGRYPNPQSPKEGTRFVRDDEVVLVWQRVIGATAYELQIAANSRFEHNLIDTTVTKASFSFEAQDGPTLYWRVRPKGDGVEIKAFGPSATIGVGRSRLQLANPMRLGAREPSKKQTPKVYKDKKSIPTDALFEVATPPQYSVVYDEMIPVSGFAKEGVVLFVNGKPFGLNPKGEFTGHVGLFVGINTIVIDATSLGGVRGVSIHYVVRKNKPRVLSP